MCHGNQQRSCHLALFDDRNRHVGSASLEFFNRNLVARLRKVEVDKASIDEVFVDPSAQVLYLT